MLSEAIVVTAAELAGALREHDASLTTVESCTGGLISAAITSLPGSSAYFHGGFVTYSNALKQRIIGVSAATLESHGAVSAQTAIEMALGGQTQANADYAIAVTGIAGPDGGSAQKPVGTVWLCIAGPNAVTDCRQFQFPGERSDIREQTVITAMRLLIHTITGIDQALPHEQSRNSA